jgi:hypothetical protein
MELCASAIVSASSASVCVTGTQTCIPVEIISEDGPTITLLGKKKKSH